MSDPEVQALAIMGYLAKFQKITSREMGGSRKNERVYVRGVDLNNVHVNKAVSKAYPISVQRKTMSSRLVPLYSSTMNCVVSSIRAITTFN